MDFILLNLSNNICKEKIKYILLGFKNLILVFNKDWTFFSLSSNLLKKYYKGLLRNIFVDFLNELYCHHW